MPSGSQINPSPHSAAYCADALPQPDITVAAVVVRDGRFLIVEERIGGRVVFNQPAGHVERGERLLQAVIRETLEETAWTFEPAALLGAYLWQPPRATRPTLRFAFIGTVTGHDPSRVLDHPVLAAHWMSRSQLEAEPARLRSPLVLRCVDDFMAGQRQPLAAVAGLQLDTAATASATLVS